MMMTRQIVMGVDEVGRGCLAGPVYAAAVILPEGEEYQEWISQIRDSKKVSPKKREKLAQIIMDNSVWYIEQTWPSDIDRYNILQATLMAMRGAVKSAAIIQTPDIVLVDGNQKIPELELPQECIKGGDDIIKAIGAASIIAKVTRDNFMQGMHSAHPEYGWNRNKGYGTKEHRDAIEKYGITPLHRRSFKGVQEYV